MTTTTLANDRLLRAARGERVSPVPIWMMRQAGRVLPEYRAFRKGHTFLEVAHTPELCAEVTVQPVDRLGVDAAILFSDILTPLPALGIGVDFAPGPVMERTLTPEEGVSSLKLPDPARDWDFLARNVRATLDRLGGRVPLIGFAGAPFTVACYLVDGGGSKHFARTRAWMHGDPAGFTKLLEFLADRLAEWLQVQVDAGVHAFQLFDSWAGILSPADLERFALPAGRRVLERVRVPEDFATIWFAPGTGTALDPQGEMPARVLGLDWRVDLADVRRRFPDRPLQGNLDPAVLLGTREGIDRGVRNILEVPGPHIFNLGHGILPETPVENAEHVVRAVHDFGGERMSAMPNAHEIAELLARYDRPGPRYTSYPTAVEFTEDVGPDAYERKLKEASQSDEPLSLYLHLPFCEHRCAFCGCHVVITTKHQVATDYLDVLHREIDLVADRLGDRVSVRQYHWGGGTPTYLTVEEMEALHRKVTSRFRIEPDAEVAIEVDPRVTSDEQLQLLQTLGFNRISMGVQDFTDEVQDAITRWQTEEQTVELVEKCRKLGFESLNLDLIYGLPKQSPETFITNLEKVIALRPGRVAVYSYAHVPWMKANQRKTVEELLPSPETKLRLFAEARAHFTAAGYDPIGMDHFALPEDELAVAAREGTLHRNFMGYTTRPAPDMIGLGISAIGDVGGAYFQNEKPIPAYRRKVEEGTLPVHRGVELTRDDLIRRQVILSIMCNWRVDKATVARTWDLDFDTEFAAELELLAPEVERGFVEVDEKEIRVVDAGRIFVRNIAMVFDERLRRMDREGPVFSRTV